MARTDLLDKDSTRSGYLVVMKPARRVTDWTLFDAINNIYSAPYDFGKIIDLRETGEVLTEVSSASLSAGEWYQDVNAETLYVRLSDNTDPGLSSKFVITQYEIYGGTIDAHAPRIPTDSSEEVVYFEPIVSIEPSLKATNSDIIFGYLPVQSSQITLVNVEHILEKHLYSSSFKRRGIEVYHFVIASNKNEVESENVKLVLNGLMGNVDYSSDGTVEIRVTDRTDDFNKEFRWTGESFFNSTDFPDLDPFFDEKPIRKVYGVVDGFTPVNVDYEDESPTTSDNRTWAVRGEASKLNNVTTTTGVGSTGTNIVVVSTSGIREGDNILVGSQSTTVTGLGSGPPSLDVDPAITAPGSGVTVERPSISKVTIIQDDEEYEALFDRDYTINSGLANDVLGFDFKTTLESNLSLPNTLSPADQVYVRVYGPENDVTLGGPALGSDDTETGNLAAPAPILVDILKQYVGLSEDMLDNTSFTDLNSATTEALGFAIPEEASGTFPKLQTIIAEILQTILARFYLNNDGEWRIELIEPLSGSSDLEVTDGEINENGFRYSLDFEDIASDVRVEYAFRERAEDVSQTSSSVKVKTGSSQLAKFLHNTNATKVIKSHHIKADDAQNLADHLAFIFGDRQGLASVALRPEFFDILLGEKVDVSRDQLPGFDFIRETLRTRQFAVIESDKRLRTLRITMDDQKGIQDNSSSW